MSCTSTAGRTAPTTSRLPADPTPVSGWRDRTLLDLLQEHGLEASREHPLTTDGWSGASFAGLADGLGRRYVLKRTSLAVDWIARATADHELREAWLAAMSPRAAAWMPPGARPALGAAADGDGVAILTPDLGPALLAWERPHGATTMDLGVVRAALAGIARLHATPWARALESAGDDAPAVTVPWCPLVERLTLLTRPSAARYAAEGNPVGQRFLAGWDAFDRTATGPARDLIARLSEDPTPLVVALGRLPTVGLHGDLKLGNVALHPDGRVGFIDWAMVLRAPVAVELGWLFVANSAVLPAPSDVLLADYLQALRDEASSARDADGVLGDVATQRDLAWIVGLLLRGWRKGLDAEGQATLASGVRAGDDLAWWCDAAVAAADRRL